MSNNAVQTKNIVARPSVSEVLDQAWIEEGMSLQELETNKRLADIFDQLLASGRTAEDINAEWNTKTVEEILCCYKDSFVPEANSTG